MLHLVDAASATRTMDERVRRHAHLGWPVHMCHRVNGSGRSAQTEIERHCTMADERELLDLIGTRREGILAGVSGQGYPHLTNIWYVWDPGRRIARVSTTADRVKGRMFRRDPHAALHVPGDHFFSY